MWRRCLVSSTDKRLDEKGVTPPDAGCIVVFCRVFNANDVKHQVRERYRLSNVKFQLVKSRLLRRLIPSLLALAVLSPLWVAASVEAQNRTDTSVYLVSGISVDVTAGTASDAREQALDEGQARALILMTRRLTRAADWSRLPSIRPEEAERFVLDFEIEDERSSDVRYLATINVRFRPDVVREFLRGTRIPFVETASLPVVVVPILHRGGTTLLWEEENQWRDAWSGLPGAAGLVPLLTPFGDISDIQSVSASDAQRGDRASLTKLARNYGADDSLIAVATLSGENRPSVEVSLTRIGSTRQTPITFTVRAASGQGVGSLLREAATTAAARIQDAWIAANAPQFGREQAMMVEVRYDGLAGWVAVNERLGRVAAVARSQVRMLSRRTAQIEISFAGSFDQLSTAIAQAGLRLSRPSRRQEQRRFGQRQPATQNLPILELASRL